MYKHDLIFDLRVKGTKKQYIYMKCRFCNAQINLQRNKQAIKLIKMANNEKIKQRAYFIAEKSKWKIPPDEAWREAEIIERQVDECSRKPCYGRQEEA